MEMSLLSIQFSKVRSFSLIAASCLFSVFPFLVAAESLTTYARHRFDGQSVIFTTSSGQRLRITPYGNSIVRVQAVRKGEDYYSDDHYEMIESHHWVVGSFDFDVIDEPSGAMTFSIKPGRI